MEGIKQGNFLLIDSRYAVATNQPIGCIMNCINTLRLDSPEFAEKIDEMSEAFGGKDAPIVQDFRNTVNYVLVNLYILNNRRFPEFDMGLLEDEIEAMGMEEYRRDEFCRRLDKSSETFKQFFLSKCDSLPDILSRYAMTVSCVAIDIVLADQLGKSPLTIDLKDFDFAFNSCHEMWLAIRESKVDFICSLKKAEENCLEIYAQLGSVTSSVRHLESNGYWNAIGFGLAGIYSALCNRLPDELSSVDEHVKADYNALFRRLGRRLNTRNAHTYHFLAELESRLRNLNRDSKASVLYVLCHVLSLDN